MYRHILCLGLLGYFSQGAYAACDVDVSLEYNTLESSIVFNPFNPVSTNINLKVSRNNTGGDHTISKVSFAAPLTTSPKSSLAGFPHYTILNDSNVTVFDSDVLGTPSNVISSLNGSLNAANPLRYPLEVTPDTQPNGDTALAPLDDANFVTLPITIEGIDSSGTTCSGTHNIPMQVSVSQHNAIALTDSFLNGKTNSSTLTQDPFAFGAVGQAGATITNKQLFLWSNTNYTISVTSEENGVMIRSGGGSGTVGLNTLPYTLTIEDSSGDDILSFDKNSNTNGEKKVVSAEQGSTIVDGDILTIDVSIAADIANKRRAGDYEDTVTILITGITL